MERSSSSSMQNGTSPLSNLRKSQRLDVFQGILQRHTECLEDERSMRKRHNNPGAGANAGIGTCCMVADSNPYKHGKEPGPVDGVIAMLQGKERGNRKAALLQMDEVKVPSTLVDIGSNADEVGIPLGQSARMEVEVQKVPDHVSSEDHVNAEMNAQVHARRELQEETFDKGGNADENEWRQAFCQNTPGAELRDAGFSLFELSEARRDMVSQARERRLALSLRSDLPLLATSDVLRRSSIDGAACHMDAISADGPQVSSSSEPESAPLKQDFSKDVQKDLSTSRSNLNEAKKAKALTSESVTHGCSMAHKLQKVSTDVDSTMQNLIHRNNAWISRFCAKGPPMGSDSNDQFQVHAAKSTLEGKEKTNECRDTNSSGQFVLSMRERKVSSSQSNYQGKPVHFSTSHIYSPSMHLNFQQSKVGEGGIPKGLEIISMPKMDDSKEKHSRILDRRTSSIAFMADQRSLGDVRRNSIQKSSRKTSFPSRGLCSESKRYQTHNQEVTLYHNELDLGERQNLSSKDCEWMYESADFKGKPVRSMAAARAPTAFARHKSILGDRDIILTKLHHEYIKDTFRIPSMDIFSLIESIRLSRADLFKLVFPAADYKHVDGFFVRLRFGKWEEELGGSGYRMACIRGARAEAEIGAGKLCLLVDLGDMECMIDSTHVSNQCFTKAELADWWHAKGSSVPDTEHLKTKLRERQAWA